MTERRGSSAIAVPFRSRRMAVEPAWIDYNGHMNVAYYVVLFDRCVDEAFLTLGLGPDYVAARNASYFTVEIHVTYLRELHLGSPVAATFQLLAFDEKRVRAYMELLHADEGTIAATCEELYLHVDMASRRTAPFPDDILARLAAMRAAHSALSWPERAGRAIMLGESARTRA